jgi:NAD dependent epimerase/dehydratase family enzyme
MPLGLPAYKPMLELGALLIGTETELILKSRWVLPDRLLKSGYTFAFPRMEAAMHNIIKNGHGNH